MHCADMTYHSTRSTAAARSETAGANRVAERPHISQVFCINIPLFCRLCSSNEYPTWHLSHSDSRLRSQTCWVLARTYNMSMQSSLGHQRCLAIRQHATGPPRRIRTDCHLQRQPPSCQESHAGRLAASAGSLVFGPIKIQPAGIQPRDQTAFLLMQSCPEDTCYKLCWS